MKFGLPRRKGSSPNHHFSGAALNFEGVAFGSWWHMDTNNWRFSAWLDLGLAVAAPLLPLPNRQPSVSWCARDGWESRFVGGIYPICSMYGIFTCIWHEFTVNVGKHPVPWSIWVHILHDSLKMVEEALLSFQNNPDITVDGTSS